MQLIKYYVNITAVRGERYERIDLMPRMARKDLESNYLHIIVQGINREYIFEDNNLKEAYKNILKKNIKEKNITVLAYCIMDNHAHILVYGECIKEISKLMQETNTSYAKLYNNVNKRVGYVFRDRYYTQMILTETQLLNCLVYIHNNPVKANIVNKPDKYKYSSYLEYIKPKSLINKESIKIVFGSNKKYIETFKQIHKYNDLEDEIIDIYEDEKNYEKTINEYMKKYNKNIQEIKEDEKVFGKLLIELKYKDRMSLRDIGNVFNISKDKVYRAIKKNI